MYSRPNASEYVIRQAQIAAGMLSFARTGFTLPSFPSVFAKTRFVDAGSGAERKKKIMLVDDERDITIMFKSGLERNGLSVEVFNDPEQALASFKPDHFDLLLFDIKMPKMSGFELGSEIRKQDRDAKIFFISAFEIPEDEMRKYMPENDERCILKKPVSIRDLVKTINDELSR